MGNTAIFSNAHFTTQFELYISKEDNVVNSYAISTDADMKEILPLLLQNNVDTVIFYGILGIYRKIEKELKNNQMEVKILWQ